MQDVSQVVQRIEEVKCARTMAHEADVLDVEVFE